MYYFAYGSNMDKSRMEERSCVFKTATSAVLKEYKLVFNKRSFKDPTMGFGNIEKNENSIVEGILYELDDSMIHILDKYEGYPKHYNRVKLTVNTSTKIIEADVYIANTEWISENLTPSAEYLSHFLAGEKYLSSKYFEDLKKVKTK